VTITIYGQVCRRRRQYDSLDLFPEGEEEVPQKASMARAGPLEKEPRISHVLQQAGKTIGMSTPYSYYKAICGNKPRFDSPAAIGSWTRLVQYDWGKGLTAFNDADRRSPQVLFIPIGEIAEVPTSRQPCLTNAVSTRPPPVLSHCNTLLPPFS